MKEARETTELVKRAKGHDPDAFTELMQFYMKDMYRTAIAILSNDPDAADAIQDTILAAWEKISTLKDNRFYKTWMTRILINKCYDILKQREKEILFEKQVDTAGGRDPAVQEDPNIRFKEMLAILDEKYRVPMMLYYGQGYKIKEIAEMLHIPKSTVQTRLDRGRDKLAVFYESRIV
ncbi:MAG: sigma-70 family RNA polymerase sigma factor [Lachnospiraceae bacterium]|nr:sigma-70 family RNA polymerase sigma factor [Lachnospiraceae bacterium]